MKNKEEQEINIVSINKISIQIGKKTIELTEEEAKALKVQLNLLYADSIQLPVFIPYQQPILIPNQYPVPQFPYPYQSPVWYGSQLQSGNQVIIQGQFQG